MITEINFASAWHVKRMPFSKDTVLISIRDKRSKTPTPSLSKFKDSLVLYFKDRCEEEYGMNAWPLYPTKQFMYYLLRVKNERLFDLNDAQSILDFFLYWQSTDQKIKLLVHCKSGVSRSAAVANWLGEAFKIPTVRVGPHRDTRPNLRVLRLLNKAYFLEFNQMPNYGKYTGVNTVDHFTKYFQV